MEIKVDTGIHTTRACISIYSWDEVYEVLSLLINTISQCKLVADSIQYIYSFIVLIDVVRAVCETKLWIGKNWLEPPAVAYIYQDCDTHLPTIIYLNLQAINSIQSLFLILVGSYHVLWVVLANQYWKWTYIYSSRNEQEWKKTYDRTCLVWLLSLYCSLNTFFI